MNEKSSRRGRITALAGLLVVLTLFGVIAAAYRTELVEYWLILGLSSTDERRRAAALEELVTMKSARAVPYLIRLIDNEPREAASFFFHSVPGSQVVSRAVGLTPIAHALYRVGPAALPGVRRRIDGLDGSAPRNRDLKTILVQLREAWTSANLVVLPVSYDGR